MQPTFSNHHDEDGIIGQQLVFTEKDDQSEMRIHRGSLPRIEIYLHKRKHSLFDIVFVVSDSVHWRKNKRGKQCPSFIIRQCSALDKKKSVIC